MSDEALVRTIRAGQVDAYTTLVGRYQEPIYRLCYRMCGNPVDAETLAHDSFVDAYLKLEQLQNPERFGPWVRTIALNQCHMWYRQHRRLTELSREEALYAPEDESNNGEDHAALYLGLSHLSAFHRMVLALHYWEGLSYEEVARFLDIPIGTVMSRLHRARHELKRRLEQEEREETTMMPPTEDFARDVEAEIRVLLRLVHANRDAQERLSVLFSRAPQHLIALMRTPEDTQVLTDLALLLGRLGVTGIETTLAAYFSAEKGLRANAAEVLAQFASQNPAAKRGATMTRITDRGIYLLVDRLIQFSEAEPTAKVELLLDLLAAASKQERTALLLTNTLLCWPEEAQAALSARFWQTADPGDVFRPADNLHALCRMGARFAALLIPRLKGGTDEEDIRVQRLAFHGAEALARTLHCDWFDLDTVSDEEVALDARFRRKWAVPLRQDRDPQVMRSLAEAVAPLARAESSAQPPDTRERAVRTLGNLRAQEELPYLLAAVEEGNAPSLRHTALRALGDTRDPRVADFLVETIRSTDPMDRRLAVEALGKLAMPRYLPLFTESLQDPDTSVRVFALYALRQIGNEEAIRVVQQAAQSPVKGLHQAAAHVLHSLSPGHTQEAPRQNGQGRFRMSEVVRGGSKPSQYISLETVLRALPEVRPYSEHEITRLIAQVCFDYSSTRRYLIEEGLFFREQGRYELTEIGQTVWRVERFISDRYMR